MKNLPVQWILLAIIGVSCCRATLDPFEFGVHTDHWDALLNDWDADNQQHIWDNLHFPSAYSDHPPDSHVSPPRSQPINMEAEMGPSTRLNHGSEPLIRTQELIHGNQEYPAIRVNRPRINVEYANGIAAQHASADSPSPGMTTNHMSGPPVNSYHPTAAADVTIDPLIKYPHAAGGQVVDLTQDTSQSQEHQSRIPSLPTFNWRGISIPDVPIDIYEKRLINELNSKRTRPFAVHSVSGSPTRTTSDDANVPFKEPRYYDLVSQIPKKRKTIAHHDMSETDQNFRLIFTVNAFRETKDGRFAFFPKVVEHLVAENKKQKGVLFIEPGEAESFILRFQFLWNSMEGKPAPAHLVSMGFTSFYQQYEHWKEFYQSIWGISDDGLLKRMWKLRSGLSDQSYGDYFYDSKLTESLMLFFFLIDMITTIYPKPEKVDVTLDKRQLLKSAFEIFKGHIYAIDKYKTLDPDTLKTPSFIWGCVERWILSRQDFSLSLMDPGFRPQRMDGQFKKFFSLVFAHSISILSSELARYQSKAVLRNVSKTNPP
ncbi:hypothetical protein MJO28_009864 [Puccinia striiformis f. sp. tritici]|uniref:ELMO domain-containing protein n=4 Tax=Puccinia striiformis TaxID=27350 RepID=A0A0L0VN99_9BASI|nr:hypothetical protein MJO28_009864 [Puccinia striiformis f. sp. tritici]KAI9622462.1 hypothetical protein H4Q26_015142 [Puccinia striiformis f. sp. tritici PST-130]KNF00687.1 hypothetical protein PSTG_06101 [Puccinia striiformis f. sp. tritici PST-78]POV98378.1 hypothetical protein PSHT_14051 [Puccinia striiformis]KAI7950958.1 hypothetical protein MJO29_009632 [Puccinia striiformis f. sp. tritici]